MATRIARSKEVSVGVGYYTAPEAAKLLRFTPIKVRRWMRGYTYRSDDGATHQMPPLWDPELPANDERLEISFRDLVDLRYVGAFLEAGVSLQCVRLCIERARSITGDYRPFSTLNFRTDGKAIFMAIESELEGDELLDLKKLQYVMKEVVEPSFKDFEYDDRKVVRWRPSRSARSVVIDPKYSFGQPIIDGLAIPTRVLDDAVKAEGGEKQVALLYEVPVGLVRQAVRFEQELRAA